MRDSRTAKVVVEAYARGYRVTRGGRVTGLRVEVMSTNLDHHGYERFGVNYHGKVVSLYVHQLAAYQKFGETALAEGIQTRHFNGNSQDNRLENIGIGNASDNCMDKPEEDRAEAALHAGRAHSSLTEDDVREMRAGFDAGQPLSWAIETYDIAKSTASYIKNRITWKNV